MNTRTYLPAALAALTAIVFPATGWGENEIGYIEKFALAADREKVLGELVPGSEDYYFFHALHYQNTRNAAKLGDILAQWKKRFPDETPRRRIIENREALLSYDASPQKTIEYLKQQLGTTFQHHREVRDTKPDLPVALDAKRIARTVFERDAIENDQSLDTFSQSALETLVRTKTKLDPQQRRALLGKLQRPDVPGLVELIAVELKSEDNEGFGHFAIHGALLPEQLDALAKAVPSLVNNEEFIHAKLHKLAPSEDVDIEFNTAEREAWLDRVWAYAKTLPPSFNTIKTNVLYQRLDHDRKKGVYDAARLLEYLKLPRQAEYVNEKWLEKARDGHQSDLEADLSGVLPLLRPIHSDEALVREYFLAIFNQAATANPARLGENLMTPYTEYVSNTWLRPVLAEALIVGGHGNPERWAPWLTPADFQALKDRVDIEFSSTNAQFFQPGDDLQFDVVVKNTPKLIVKIYELNTLNFFLTQHRQLNTDLNLDGLVANSEQTHTFDSGPFKRARQTFKFPELKGKRGAWIVEFIGGGRSSRALVRAGQWQLLQQTGPAGDLLLVLDEKGEPVKDAVAWLDGRKFTPDAKLGRIAVPFSNRPGSSEIVLADPAGTFATLTQFEHHVEHYRIDAQFHIEREQLLARREATLAVRTDLMVGESHLDPALLLEPKLTITSKTLDGIATTREVKDLKLSAGSVLTHVLSVPERMAQLTVTLSGQVEVLSAGGEKRDVSASHTWTLNGMDQTEATNDGHLSKFEGNYVYELLGKNGEALAEQPIVLTFKHRDFTRTQTVELKTDEKGRVSLGSLNSIQSVHAKSPNGRESHWGLSNDERTWTSEVHARAGEVVRIPWLARKLPNAPAPEDVPAVEVSLLESKGGTFVADHRAKLAFKDGFVEITGLAPGDYSLQFRGDRRNVEIKVTDGKPVAGWYLGAHRNLQANNDSALQITGVAADKDVITIKLAHATAFTRVHVAASRFEPGEGLFAGLGGFPRFGAASGAPAKLPNLFSAGRAIGDEYRYILERRYAKLYAGNMLMRPGLLLNPWAVRDTGLDQLAQEAAQQAARTAGGKDGHGGVAAVEAPINNPEGAPAGAAAETNLDFLAASAPTIYNLIPDQDGVVRVERKMLGDRQHVQIYAEDLANAAWQSFALPEVGTKFTDQRLARNLDPAQPFTQKREVIVLAAGQTLTLADILTSELETYDTLSGIHSLLSTLSNDGTLAQFAWVLTWPKMKDDEKRAKYSEYACHELNFFLARKDPEFFAKIIKPALANKKDKTFMDDFLLGNDLAAYLEPTAYARLNVAERALLGQRVAGEAANAERLLREKWELLAPNPEEQERLFETALRGRALEYAVSEGFATAGGIMLGEKLKLAEETKLRVISDPASPGEPPSPKMAVLTPAPVVAGTTMLGGRAWNGKDTDELRRKSAAGLALDAVAVDKLADLDSDAFAVLEKDVPGAKRSLQQGRERAVALRLMGGVGKPMEQANDFDTNSLHFAYYGIEGVEAQRKLNRAYYRTLGATKEWAENNYYHLRIVQQNGDLIPVSAFWRDFAKWTADGAKGPFVSPNIAEAGHHFAEMMLALAVTDLPFDAPKHTSKADGGKFNFMAGGSVIVYHKEVKAAAAAEKVPAGQLLVSQSFFRNGDRYRMEGNEKFEKYVTGEFLTGTVYGANVVVTNPTSAVAKADVLLQIPQGALPVLGSKATNSRYVRLAPYTTQTFEYYFYFPAAAGAKKFAHFPVNVAVGGSVVGAAKPFEFNVVARLTEVDKASWDYLSQDGTEAEVFAFLEQNNLASLDLVRLAWRCQNPAFFKKLTGFLLAHHVWNETIYSYALLHNDAAALREWLQHQDPFVSQCGPWLSSKLILLDPIERRSYEHLEYSPLVNQRAHRLGGEARIANPALLGQYRSLLDILAHKPALDATDSMSVTYYLFLQDRVEEGLKRFHSIDPKALPTQIQHDYFECYADFYEGDLADARLLATKYANYPVTRWKTLFAGVTTQLDEAEGKAVAKPGEGDKPDREKQQAELAATEPSFDFKVENKSIALTFKNLGEVTVNYYLMDPEFSFSSNPFVSEDASRFSIIKPTKSDTHALPKDKDILDIALPGEFAKANVLVEVVAAGQRKAQPYHANTFKLTVTENYGRLEAHDAATDRPVPKAYVKVYARLKNGTVRFFKDGYTDLRGRFDYASLNGDSTQKVALGAASPPPANGLDYQMLKPAELREIEKMAILLIGESNGATTREVNPPKE